MSTVLPPSLDLLLQVRAAFVAQGTTLHSWCHRHRVHVTGARQALIGTWNGPKGRAMRARIVRAAGLNTSTPGAASTQPEMRRD